MSQIPTTTSEHAVDLSSLERLLEIMRRLRDPVSGCPWDQQQTMQSLAAYAIEEAYELEAAIQTKPVDLDHIRDELGDLLLQVVFHAQIASEQGDFDFPAIAESIANKMVRRHPHVFADTASNINQNEVKANWETIKLQERQAAGQDGLFDDVAVALPGLLRAVKLQKRAAKIGFDWDDPRKVIDKIREELDELEVEIDREDHEKTTAELGDVLFGVANLARHLKINPETAVKQTNQKFIDRFECMLQAAGGRQALAQMSLESLELLWQSAKSSDIT